MDEASVLFDKGKEMAWAWPLWCALWPRRVCVMARWARNTRHNHIVNHHSQRPRHAILNFITTTFTLLNSLTRITLSNINLLHQTNIKQVSMYITGASGETGGRPSPSQRGCGRGVADHHILFSFSPFLMTIFSLLKHLFPNQVWVVLTL